jgi:hypothetical protein
MNGRVIHNTPGLSLPASRGNRRVISFRDNFITFDQMQPVMDTGAGLKIRQYPIHPGEPLFYGANGRGGVQTWDGRTVDSTGAFLVGELERLDQTLHEPLAAVTWGRDIDLREDVTIADEVSSFTLTTYASNSGLGAGQGIGTGKAWIGKATDQISGVGLDIAKIPHTLRPWALEIKYTILELESAAKLGRPIDAQKYEALQLKHQMDVDEMVYYGDTNMGETGLVNNSLVTSVQNVAAGGAGGTVWTSKTPDEILSDVNTALTTVWAASAWAVIPSRALLPPAQFGYISTQKVSLAGNVSILKYIQDNNILTTAGKGKLDILPLKWCIGAGVGGTIGTVGVDRMVIYTKDRKRVRYPMTLLQRTPIQYDSIYHKSTYFCRLGAVEVVYPETMGYFDGI